MIGPLDRNLCEQYELFDAQREALTEELSGRWVVFARGAVQSDHASEDAALETAMRCNRPLDAFVVVRVAPRAGGRLSSWWFAELRPRRT
jgi:hypothetical protein